MCAHDEYDLLTECVLPQFDKIHQYFIDPDLFHIESLRLNRCQRRFDTSCTLIDGAHGESITDARQMAVSENARRSIRR